LVQFTNPSEILTQRSLSPIKGLFHEFLRKISFWKMRALVHMYIVAITVFDKRGNFTNLTLLFFIQFSCGIFQNGHVYGLLINHDFFLAIICWTKRGQKFYIFEKYIEFVFSIPFWYIYIYIYICVFLFFELILLRELLILCWQTSPHSTISYQKGHKSTKFQHLYFLIFHSI